jgi:hypothetical protein
MRHSTVTERNPKAITRMEPTNLGFFTAAAQALGRTGHRGEGAIGIVGGADLFSGMLRQAQALLRWDRRASYWSHAFLSLDPLQRRLRRRRTHHSLSVPYTHGRLRCMPRSETA